MLLYIIPQIISHFKWESENNRNLLALSERGVSLRCGDEKQSPYFPARAVFNFAVRCSN